MFGNPRVVSLVKETGSLICRLQRTLHYRPIAYVYVFTCIDWGHEIGDMSKLRIHSRCMETSKQIRVRCYSLFLLLYNNNIYTVVTCRLHADVSSLHIRHVQIVMILICSQTCLFITLFWGNLYR